MNIRQKEIENVLIDIEKILLDKDLSLIICNSDGKDVIGIFDHKANKNYTLGLFKGDAK